MFIFFLMGPQSSPHTQKWVFATVLRGAREFFDCFKDYIYGEYVQGTLSLPQP